MADVYAGMRKVTLVRWLAVACLLGLPAFSQTKTAEDRLTYLVEGMAKAEADFAGAEKREIIRYLLRLEQLREAYQKKGFLEGVIATDKEKTRVTKTERLSLRDRLSEPPGLVTIQKAAIMELESARSRIRLVRQRVLEESIRILEAQQAELVRAGKVAEAIAVKKRVQALRDRGLSALGVAAPSSSSKWLSAASKLSAPILTNGFAVPDRPKVQPIGRWSNGGDDSTGVELALTLTGSIPAAATEILLTYGDDKFEVSRIVYGQCKRKAQYPRGPIRKPVPQTKARYLRYEAGIDIHGAPYASLADISVLDASGQRIDNRAWRVVEMSSEARGDQGIESLNNGDPSTHWHSRFGRKEANPPHFIVLDMGRVIDVSAIEITPRGKNANGIPSVFAVYGGITQEDRTTLYHGRLYPQDIVPFEIMLSAKGSPEVKARLIRASRGFKHKGNKSGLYRFAIPEGMDRSSLRLRAVQLDGVVNHPGGVVLIGE